MRIPAIFRYSSLAVALIVGATSGSAFAASSDDLGRSGQQEPFWDPKDGARASGPYDQADHFLGRRGFPLQGFREIEHPLA